jgi:hypothetical protein
VPVERPAVHFPDSPDKLTALLDLPAQCAECLERLGLKHLNYGYADRK